MENKILLNSSATNKVSINITCQNENFWLSQKAIKALSPLCGDN